jgi:hypothetical protein
MTKPALAREDETGGRVYIHPLTGETVPSVTTIIGEGIPKPKLVNWAARMAAEYACTYWTRLSTVPIQQRVVDIKEAHIRYTDEKADIGDQVHSMVECWATGQPYPDPPKEIRGFTNQFINFLIEMQPRFLENECCCWSRKHGYAGSGDFIMRVNGKTLLTDLKTGKSLHPEVGLQTSALLNADFILRTDGTEEPLPHIDGIAALHVRPRSWKLVELKHPDECFRGFLAAQQVMEWERYVSPDVLI